VRAIVLKLMVASMVLATGACAGAAATACKYGTALLLPVGALDVVLTGRSDCGSSIGTGEVDGTSLAIDDGPSLAIKDGTSDGTAVVAIDKDGRVVGVLEGVDGG
jgi:hypothetical protein